MERSHFGTTRTACGAQTVYRLEGSGFPKVQTGKLVTSTMVATNSHMPCRAVLIELKNIVCCSSVENTQLPINTFKSILYCGATVEHQCGRITEEQYFVRLASDFGHSRNEIETAISAVRKSWRVNEAVLKSLVQMKAQFEDRLKFYAVTNLSQRDYALVKSLDIDWSLFEQIFVSSEMGMQKPELRFYQCVLDKIGLQAEQVISVDDDTDNILAALSLGMNGVLFLENSLSRSIIDLIQVDPFRRGTQCFHQNAQDGPPFAHTGVPVRDIFEVDPIGRGTQYLHKNARNFPSYTHTGVPVKENFAQLLILEITGDQYVRAVTIMYQRR